MIFRRWFINHQHSYDGQGIITAFAILFVRGRTNSTDIGVIPCKCANGRRFVAYSSYLETFYELCCRKPYSYKLVCGTSIIVLNILYYKLMSLFNCYLGSDCVKKVK